MKPVIVLTVFRRYFELQHSIRRIHELAGEFAEKPDIVVVWACPEVGRLWFMQQLVKEGLVHKVLSRFPLPGEAAHLPTTYPESHNLRLGLEWVRENYDHATTYVIGQAADVLPHPGKAYKFIDEHMRDQRKAVVFHWANGCVPVHIWHTNLFGVCIDDPSYWPPVLGPESQDTLEHAWGKLLREKGGVEGSHNSECKRFAHDHLSEQLPPWPVIPQDGHDSTLLLISGWKPWWSRLADWLFRRR